MPPRSSRAAASAAGVARSRTARRCHGRGMDLIGWPPDAAAYHLGESAKDATGARAKARLRLGPRRYGMTMSMNAFHRAAKPILIAALLVIGVVSTARADSDTVERRANLPTIILVHGAWADGTGWQKVI